MSSSRLLLRVPMTSFQPSITQCFTTPCFASSVLSCALRWSTLPSKVIAWFVSPTLLQWSLLVQHPPYKYLGRGEWRFSPNPAASWIRGDIIWSNLLKVASLQCIKLGSGFKLTPRIPCSAGITSLFSQNMQKTAFICLRQSKNNRQPCFIYIITGLFRAWNPAPTLHSIALTIYFLPFPPPFHLADMRREPSPFFLLLSGRSFDGQIWL